MQIYFDNSNLNSNSGPNSFARKLFTQLAKMGHDCTVQPIKGTDVQLSFINICYHIAPTVLRLDGIWFNTAQDWKAANQPIKESYKKSNAVILQSEFNKELTEKYFGTHNNRYVINNGSDLSLMNKIKPLEHDIFKDFDNVWCCASSWRPHKRLKENINYFLTHSDKNDCLIIAGNNPDYQIKNSRIFYVGNLDQITLFSLYKRSKYFIHLAFLDHCPNVVVDARAAGCKIICSSSGGTKEVAGIDATVVKDIDWNFEPLKLYEPPELDLNSFISNDYYTNIDIENVASRYESAMLSVING